MKPYHLFFIFCVITIIGVPAYGQLLQNKTAYTKQDTLRGSITAERKWWNVLRYNITVKPDYLKKWIEGCNVIDFDTLYIPEVAVMQIDLQQPMSIDSVFDGFQNRLSYKRDNNAYFISLKLLKGSAGGGALQLKIFFSGKPREAVTPPWDGGWIWQKDAMGNPWMTVACQGLGASVWYPCKDHQSDEPDSGAVLSMIIPDSLTGIGNGRLKEKTSNHNGTTTWTWEVKNPINNYNIVPYIGKYVNFSEVFDGEAGKLDLNYWVLGYNLTQAKEHMMPQVKKMLTCFEYWFGPYPFYEDGYKLVEAPHLGMEHQSAIAYGNKYKMGYMGKDWSGTGWGLKWDFLIVHESGHEWFGNNITAKDIADMWIHESFTNYSETLYTECQFGKQAGSEYVIGTRSAIVNDIPITGIYGVNKEGSGDMYWKGANMIHTIRQVINDDNKFRNILRGLNKTFYHRTVTANEVENYISRQSGINFSTVFEQYLKTTRIPELEYKVNGYKLFYRWANCVRGFDLPVKIYFKGGRWLKPTEQWKELNLYPEGPDKFRIAPDFYITTKKISTR